MIKLFPDWYKHYDEFWSSIRRRNLLFIKLRYFAVAALIFFLIFAENLLRLHLSHIQVRAFLFTAFFLLIYNGTIHIYRYKIDEKRRDYNPLHLSLLQIITDLLLLTMLIYFTGGIESPFLFFYIFHMIIGSLILPGFLVYFFALSIISIIGIIAYSEFTGIIPHCCLFGLFGTELYNKPTFVIITFVTFGTTLLLSVFLANKIARQLYLQEDHLITALEELKSSDEKKQKYIMGVMHEIKSPIAASQSLLDLITEGYLGKIPPKILDKLNKARNRNKEAIEMINDILRISRIHLMNESELEEIEPKKLLKEEIEKVEERAKAKNIRIKLLETEGTSAKIRCDVRVMRLALSNILNNAVKYTDQNGRIEGKVRYSENFVEIKICDNGKGIPKEEQEKVFVPFYRLKREQGKSEGSGLGLALVKEIINQHKGEILLESPSWLGDKENPGTCFTLKIPYSPVHASAEKLQLTSNNKI